MRDRARQSRWSHLLRHLRLRLGARAGAEWAGASSARHENSVTKITKITKIPEMRHENLRQELSEGQRGGRPKSLKPLTDAQRSKLYRERKKARFSVTLPGYEKDIPLHELKKTARQGETAARDGAFKPGPRDAGLTPKQRRRFHWVQATLSYGWSALPTQQIVELMNALPDELVVDWVCGRAELPNWAKHSLEALHKRRKGADTAQPLSSLALPIVSGDEDAA